MENVVNYVKIAAVLGAAFAMGIGTLGPSLAQGMVGSKACENVGKYPESFTNLRALFIIALTVIETSSLYALLVAMLLILYV